MTRLDKLFAVCMVATLVSLITLILAVSAEAHFTSGCKGNACKAHVVKPFNDRLNRMAACESGHRWSYSGPGFYDGGLQFDPRTWDATGSRFRYAWQAPKLEQKYRAVVWASKIGWAWKSTAGWPVCG